MNQIILQLISTYSLIYGVDPNLALAVASHESKLNPQAIGSLGEIGLMQLRPEFFADSCLNRVEGDDRPCGSELFRPDINLKIGIRNLAEIQKSCAHKDNSTWIICHNLGVAGGSRIRRPMEFIYYRLVMEEYRKIINQNLFKRTQSPNWVATNP